VSIEDELVRPLAESASGGNNDSPHNTPAYSAGAQRLRAGKKTRKNKI